MNSIENTTIIPPTRPAKNPPPIVMLPQPAVMATSPAITPLRVIPKLGLPSFNQVVAIAPTAPPAAAIFVTITTAEAAKESSPPQAN